MYVGRMPEARHKFGRGAVAPPASPPVATCLMQTSNSLSC